MSEVIVLSSDTCSFCEVMKKRLEEMGVKYREVKIESGEGKRLVEEYDIRALPATIIRKEKKEVILIGLPPEEEIRRAL